MNCKVALGVTLFLFIIAGIILVNAKLSKGEFIGKGVEFRGGKVLEIETKESLNAIKEKLSKEKDLKIQTSSLGKTSKVIIEMPYEKDEDKILSVFEKDKIISYSSYSVSEEIAKGFFSQAVYAIIFAYILMAGVIFFLFKEVVPSLGVILAATFDIIETIATMNLLGIKLTAITLVALIMILGYSVDTDILLTTRVLKKREKKGLEERIKSAMKTGLTMTFTSIGALFVMILVAGYNSIFGQLASVLIIALLFDIPNTWLQNACILKIWLEKKKS